MFRVARSVVDARQWCADAAYRRVAVGFVS